jgi:hypothetical protein
MPHTHQHAHLRAHKRAISTPQKSLSYKVGTARFLDRRRSRIAFDGPHSNIARRGGIIGQKPVGYEKIPAIQISIGWICSLSWQSEQWR